MRRLPINISISLIAGAVWCALPAFALQSQQPRPDPVEARQEWLRNGRTAKGENPAELLERGYREKMSLREAARQRMADATRARRAGDQAPPESYGTLGFQNLIWSSLGPSPLSMDPGGLHNVYSPVTGRVTAIAVDQRDGTGNTVYVGGSSGGVWKSTNAASSDPSAVTWQALTDDQPSLAVGSIALQPGSNLVLVGTGETNSSPDSYYGMGILRSTDAGQTWNLVSAANNGTRSFRGLGFSRIAFSTANPHLVVAAAASTNGSSPGGNGAETQGADGRGLYYSTDDGQSWSYASVNDPAGPIQPGSVGDVVYDTAHGKFYAVIRWHGYYSSTDGANWTRLAQQPGGITTAGCPANPTDNTCPEYRGSLSVRQDTGELFTIFVNSLAQSSGGGGGIFLLSANNGAWTQLSQSSLDSCGDSGQDAGCGSQQGTFNLYIKAVPNGVNTDLYVGAVNIFKCSRTSVNQLCTGTAWKNLTHVYGCSPNGLPARVHPDQHAIDYSTDSQPTRIYFGNDGGIYRALDGNGLASSLCNVNNAFDHLNANMGSLSEFVSFAQHPTDPGILLGGLQDNGSPGLNPNNAGPAGRTWQGLNESDGGYNAIDPNTPNVFYTSFYDVSVQRCVAGTSCTVNSWSSIVGPGTVGSDGSSFYTPFILDPQASGNLLVGTCRLWRGPSAGGIFTAISRNFSVGDTSICAGGTTTGATKIRSIAAGGPVGNGSQVIYAGMVGAAPLNGHVFVTTSADGGLNTWADRTGNINPSGFDISDIAVSPYDSTGRTAYLTIMGFGTSHVFKTTDAGATWSNKSGNLPDVPANSVVVDPITANTVYVGTDVGVFLTADDGATWAELGTGLPNVPSVKLKTFVSGGVKKLRVATYGRGMWQIDLPQPDIAFFSAPLSFAAVVGRASAGQQVTLSNLTAAPVTLNGISASGDFAATNDCPSLLNPGSNCTVTVTFAPHSAGVRANSLSLASTAGSRTLTLNGNGVDFALTLPRPPRPMRSLGVNSPVTQFSVTRGQQATTTLNISASDSAALAALADTDTQVQLRCASAMAGVQCHLSPAAADLAQGDSTVTLTVTADAPKTARRLRVAPAPGGDVTVIRVTATSGAQVRTIEVSLAVR